MSLTLVSKSQCETKDGCHVNQTLPKVPQDVRRDVVGHKKADVHKHNASNQYYASRAVVYPILGISLHICTFFKTGTKVHII